MLPASLSAKWLPQDFVEASRTGGALTLVAYAVMLAIFVVELRVFFSRESRALLALDEDTAGEMQIHLDFVMLGVSCRNLEVRAIDSEREEALPIAKRELMFRDTGDRQMGTFKGKVRNTPPADMDDEEHTRFQLELAQADGKAELDADWSASHDGFKHKSFEHVIQFHDFTLINFFAGWCVHCQKFAPTWAQFAKDLQGKTFEDHVQQKRTVTAIKINCVEFNSLCREQGIQAYPTIRLYKGDMTLSPYNGAREIPAMTAFVDSVVRSTTFGWVTHHSKTQMGCSVIGFVKVPRAPGRLEFTVGQGDQDMQPSMTNVSHRLLHMSFKDPRYQSVRLWRYLPAGTTPMNSPLSGKLFSTDALHQTWEHHLRVVSTLTPDDVAYQYVHHGRRALVAEDVIPQVRFHYDIEPFAIRLKNEFRPWYDFATSMLAALGGLFALFRLLSRALLAMGRALPGGGGNGSLIK